MIKGVNKRIVEINFPASIYFEKAVVFLRADSPPASAAVLAEEARADILALERSFSKDTSELFAKKLKLICTCIFTFLFKVSVMICAGAVLLPEIRG